MDVTLKIDELSLSNRLCTYSVTTEISYRKVVKTLDEYEHPYPGDKRPIINFSLLPGTDDEDAELFDVLERLVFEVVFTHKGADVYRTMRLDSDLQSTFLLKSVDGKRRYNNGVIVLRGL